MPTGVGRHAANNRGLFRTTDQGRSWQQWSTWSLAGWTSKLIVDPRDSSRLYAGIGTLLTWEEPPVRGVFGSFDGGVTWNLLGQGLPEGRFIGALDLDRQLPATLYAGTEGEGVFRLDLFEP